MILSGWVNRRRDHGGLIFIDLRDRYGITQVVSNPSQQKTSHKVVNQVRPEFVIKVEGKVRKRPKEAENPKMKTGQIEVLLEQIEILSEALTPPFEIESPLERTKEFNEELRLEYRYLDLRRERMKRNIIERHRIIKCLRDLMDREGFIEIETPVLIKGTPEGSREYLVPSRLHPGKFYVLPQSPQQLKQLLMVSGFDRYFQIVRCFRDEDLRGDRQPEFTQLDLEMSFATENEVMEVNERVLLKLLSKFVPQKKIITKPLVRLTYKQAMNRFGSDKPDLRFEMELKDVTDLADRSDFKIFKEAIKKGGVVKALKVEGGAKFSSKEIAELEEVARIYGAKGLVSLTLEKEGPKSYVVKYFKEKDLDALLKRCQIKKGDLLLLIADEWETACLSLGQVRLKIAEKLILRDPSKIALCWVTDFSLFEWSKEEEKLASVHHLFTSPKDEDLKLLDREPLKVKAKAYDLVMNGCEIGGGSIRIHNPELQSKIFRILEISGKEAERRFGHLLKAFRYGVPPHGGIAWGLDRLIMLILDEPNIREVIAFPKDQSARDLMMGAPSELPEEQVREMHLKILRKET